MTEPADMVEYVWPPSEKSAPALVGLVAGMVGLVWFLFLAGGESEYAVKAKAVMLERIEQGMKLMLKDVEAKDKAHKKGKERDTGLPEVGRVLSFLWSSTHEEETTTVVGLSKTTEEYKAVQSLLDRSLRAEVRKAIDFTKQAQKMEREAVARLQHSAAPAADALVRTQTVRADQDVVDANEEWMKAHDTSRKEVDEFVDGEKLENTIKQAETILKNLGESMREASTLAIVKEGRTEIKQMKMKGAQAIRRIFAIASSAIPMWFFSICLSIVAIQFWTEIDKIVLTGRIATDAQLPDGSGWDRSISQRLALQVAISGFFHCGLNCVADLVMQKAQQKFTMKLKATFMKCMVFQDYAYFEKHGAGTLQERLNSDVQKVTDSVMSLPKDFLLTIARIIMKVAYAASFAPLNAVIVAVAPLPLIAEGNRRLTNYRARKNETGRKISEQATVGTMEVISNIKTVRGFAMEHDESVRYQRSISLQNVLVQNTSLVSQTTDSFFWMLFIGNLGLTSYACASEVAAGNMEQSQVVNFMINVGCFVFFQFQGLIQMLPRIADMLLPLNRIAVHLDSQSKIEPNPNDPTHCPFEVVCSSEAECKKILSQLKTVECSPITQQFHEGPTRAFGQYIKTTASLTATNGTVKVGAKLLHIIARTGEEDPVFSVPELEEKFAERKGRFPIKIMFSRMHVPDKFSGSIKFDNVVFYYPTDLRTRVLDGMSFDIKPGQKIGLCGEAGCGKSTAFQLIQRLYDADPSGGNVMIDGRDIREYNIHYLRRAVCMVAQQSILFKTTVRENIAYGMKPMPSDAEITAALKKAQAWDFIDKKPDKLLTMLTETGGGFSGGQMQRLAIARVLIRKPQVILLDEATAALDPVNERAVQDVLDVSMKGFTTLAIAHRLTTIKDADKIIVLHKGRVVEQGTHDELLKIPVDYDVNDDGKQLIKSGYYNHQWKTQFQEKNLTTKKLQDKVVQLEQEIQMHQGQLSRTQKHMRQWKAAGRLAASGRAKKSESALAEKAVGISGADADGTETLDEEQEEFAHTVCLSRCISVV